MTATSWPAPAPFTGKDYIARRARAVDEALAVGLDSVVVAPGPDLVWLTGYRPTAITERLTMLFLAPDQPPTLLVPTLERPDAEAAGGVSELEIVDWSDGSDPYQAARQLLRAEGTFGISDSAWAMHLLGLQSTFPTTHYRALSQALPMLRAVKDGAELTRMTAAGRAADATYTEVVKLRFAGRRES